MIWTFQAQTAARAKALRAKFERWEEKENRTNANAATHASHAAGNLNGSLDHDQSSEHIGIDTTKSLRARFESLKNESQQPKERTPRPKVNRFVVSTCWYLLYCLFCWCVDMLTLIMWLVLVYVMAQLCHWHLNWKGHCCDLIFWGIQLFTSHRKRNIFNVFFIVAQCVS